MKWHTPRYDEIKMDAEIGSYQPDRDSPPDPYGDFASPTESGAEPASATD